MFIKFSIPSLARRYSIVSQNSEDTEAFLPSPEKAKLPSVPSPKSHRPITCFTATLLLFSIATAAVGFCIGQKYPTNLDSVSTRHTTKYCESIGSQKL
jgi:hypothetical protein